MYEENPSSVINDYKTDFQNRLRYFRNKRQISAREMSLYLGQNVNYINLIENGKRLPSLQGFFSICEYLKITPSDFFRNTDIEKNHREEKNIFDMLNEEQILRLKDFIKSIIK